MIQALILNFTQSILPITLVVFTGYVLRRRIPIDPKQVTQIAFNLMLPALIFREVYLSDLPLEESFNLVGLTLALLVILMLIGWIIVKLFKADHAEGAAIILVVAFMNCGNFGLSVSEFAYGSEALAWASLFFVTVVVVNMIVGVYAGESGRMLVTKAVRQIFKVPIIYAISGAFLIKALQVEIPQAVLQPIDLLGSGAIPLMLILLGVQLAETGIPKNLSLVWLTAMVRLIVSPVIAYGLTMVIAVQGLPLKVAVLQAGMPIAVMNGLIATEYDLEPRFVTSTILVSTLISPLTLAVLLSLLNTL